MTNKPVGLIYVQDFISPEFERQLINWIDQQTWNTSLKRRTQHYGYEYNYSSRAASKKTTPLSGPLLELKDMLSSIMESEQCIINEYTKNQGISAHIDALTFGPVICSVSLNCPCNMIFTRGNESYSVYLAPRSLVCLTKEARYQWKHEIKPNTTILSPIGEEIKKSDDYRRLSLTFRTMNKTNEN